AALLTGCYPNRVGIHGALAPWSTIALSPSEETLAEVLKAEGYRTGMVGKWHLGSNEPYLPLQQGFDEYLGLPYSNDMWPVHYDGKPISDTSNRRSRYPKLPLIEGNNTIKLIETLDDQAMLTALYTERACKFIRDSKDDPFFLYLAHSMPHVPLAVSGKFRGKSRAGLFGDLMMEIDWSVGQIMHTLDELGLSENTLLVFTSDNGPWRNYGDHAGSTGGLREGKGTSWEGGQRVPCIMRWKGKIPAGTISNKLASTIDLLPTVAGLCKARLPAREIDGVDISALLRGDTRAEPRKDFAYYYNRNSLEAVRKGPWKLVLPHVSRTYLKDLPGYGGFPGKISLDTVELALYNLHADPGESLDLKDTFPKVVNELQEIAERYRESLGDDLSGRAGNERREPASIKPR
ncbi:MAG TPA: sulfatase, partial [Anseongella sp.]|nr:sulfatase [Anseongella sp.]